MGNLRGKKMREIKFRLWNTVNKEFTTPSILKIGNDGLMYYQRDGDHIISQFTGLHDKNGKQGFDGDIVNVGEGNIYVIEFKWGEFRLYSLKARINNKEEYHISIGAHLKQGEIIGNIYENPNLLEKDDER